MKILLISITSLLLTFNTSAQKFLRSESEIENYIDEIDALMVGPHLAYILDDIDEYTEGNDVKVILMKADYYSTLNGEKAIAHLMEEMNK